MSSVVVKIAGLEETVAKSGLTWMAATILSPFTFVGYRFLIWQARKFYWTFVGWWFLLCQGILLVGGYSLAGSASELFQRRGSIQILGLVWAKEQKRKT